MTLLISVESGSLSLEVDPQLAGRVTRLLFRGENLLSTPKINPDNWGATYWTSPQSDWGWPPVPEVDHAPYELLIASPQEIALRSPEAQIGERRFRIEKRFSKGPGEGTIDTFYSIENCGATPFRMANWEISRVPAGGLTFFPTGQKELNAIAPHHHLPIEKEFGTTFYDHSKFAGDRCLKMHADGTGGYLAHRLGNLLILKIFQDSTPEDQAPGEGECEIFANEDGAYVEIEVQGRYATILPGERETFCIRTLVIELPSELHADDRAKLRAFADECCARTRS